MSRLKFSKLEVDKNVSQLSSSINRKTKSTATRGVVSVSDLKRGEFRFTTVGRGQDGPSGPAADEARIYFKTDNGELFVFTGTKVG